MSDVVKEIASTINIICLLCNNLQSMTSSRMKQIGGSEPSSKRKLYRSRRIDFAEHNKAITNPSTKSILDTGWWCMVDLFKENKRGKTWKMKNIKFVGNIYLKRWNYGKNISFLSSFCWHKQCVKIVIAFVVVNILFYMRSSHNSLLLTFHETIKYICFCFCVQNFDWFLFLYQKGCLFFHGSFHFE